MKLASKLSFIIPLFNNIEATKEMFATLIPSIPECIDKEIIFVDDFSTDSTKLWLSNLNLDFIIKIYNNKNLGFAVSNNIAAKLASGRIIIFLNNDLIFQNGWLEPMIEIFNLKELNAGVVGNLQYRVSDGSLDHAGVFVSEVGKITHVTQIESQSSYLKSFAVSAACCAILRSDFETIGGFDESFINGGEDIDLCLEIKKTGKKIYTSMLSKVFHHVSLTRSITSIQNEKNSRHLLYKWRKEIKSEIASLWTKNSIHKNLDFSTLLDGKFTSNFTKYNQTLSLVIAEHFLLREEHRWSKLIDGKDLNEDIANRTSTKGLHYDILNKYYYIDNEAEIILSDTKSIVNFYLCGRRLDASNYNEIKLTIYVNDIQYKTFVLDRTPNFNVGIVDPILFQSPLNKFHIKINFFDPKTNNILDDASHLVAITHFVLDDKLVKKD